MKYKTATIDKNTISAEVGEYINNLTIHIGGKCYTIAEVEPEDFVITRKDARIIKKLLEAVI